MRTGCCARPRAARAAVMRGHRVGVALGAALVTVARGVLAFAAVAGAWRPLHRRGRSSTICATRRATGIAQGFGDAQIPAGSPEQAPSLGVFWSAGGCRCCWCREARSEARVAGRCSRGGWVASAAGRLRRPLLPAALFHPGVARPRGAVRRRSLGAIAGTSRSSSRGRGSPSQRSGYRR